MKSRAGISVMFMTFIAVSILSLIFISYYLYLTQHNFSASEAQRIYAEAAQESIDAFVYPPASEASSQGISQTLVIHNRGIGAVIKYLFYRDGSGLHGPLNGGDVVLRSGEVVRLQLGELMPDGAEMLIVTERGSIFAAQEGYFTVSLSPAKLILYLEGVEEGVSTLTINSNNYEGRMIINHWTNPPTCPQISYEIEGEMEFNLAKDGLHALTIKVEAQNVGDCTILISAVDPENGYFKATELAVEVKKKEIAPALPTFSYVTLTIPEEFKDIVARRRESKEIQFIVEGHNGYVGELSIRRFVSGWYCYRVAGGVYTQIDCNLIFSSYIIYPTSISLDPRILTSVTGDFSFTISNNIPYGTYEIWIHAYESPPSGIVRAADYFTLRIVP